MTLAWYEEQMAHVFKLAKSLVGVEFPVACAIVLNFEYAPEFSSELLRENYAKMRELGIASAKRDLDAQEKLQRSIEDDCAQRRIVAIGLNRVEKGSNPAAHAEMDALNSFYERFTRYQAKYFDVIVNLEPCMMCSGALLLAGFKSIAFANFAQKTGALMTLLDAESLVRSSGGIYRSSKIIGGICESQGLEILRSSIR